MPDARSWPLSRLDYRVEQGRVILDDGRAYPATALEEELYGMLGEAAGKLTRAETENAALRETLERIRLGIEGDQTYSGTQCSEIAAEALLRTPTEGRDMTRALFPLNDSASEIDQLRAEVGRLDETLADERVSRDLYASDAKALRARLVEVEAKVRYYESALTIDDRKLVALGDGVVAKPVRTERVADLCDKLVRAEAENVMLAERLSHFGHDREKFERHARSFESGCLCRWCNARRTLAASPDTALATVRRVPHLAPHQSGNGVAIVTGHSPGSWSKSCADLGGQCALARVFGEPT